MKAICGLSLLFAGLSLSAVWAESPPSGPSALEAVTIPRAPEDASNTGGSAETMLNRRKPIRDVSSKKARVRVRGTCVDGNGRRYKAGQDGYTACLEQAESTNPVTPEVRAHGQTDVGTANVHF